MLKLLFLQILIELKNIFRSKGLLTILILGPITYGLLYPQPYLTEIVRKVPIAVIDNDNSNQSRQFIRDLNTTDTIDASTFVSSLEEGEQLLKQQKIYGIVMIPIRFERDIIEGRSTSIPFYADASYILIYNNIATTLTTVVTATNGQIAIDRKIMQGVDPSIAKRSTLLFSPTMISLFNPQSGYATYIIPPAFILILHQLLFVGILAYGTVYRSEELKYFDKINPKIKGSTLLSTLCILTGKGLAYLLLYSLFYWIYFIFVVYLYGIPNLANPLLTQLPFSLIFIIATTFFAQFVSTFVKKLDTIFLLYVPLSIIFFFLAGISWPKTAIPEWMSYLSYLIPSTSAIDISIELSQMGASFSLLSNQIVMLSFLAIFYFLLTF